MVCQKKRVFKDEDVWIVSKNEKSLVVLRSMILKLKPNLTSLSFEEN